MSPRPAAHTPRRLRRAGLSGADFPIAVSAGFVPWTPKGRCLRHTGTQQAARPGIRGQACPPVPSSALEGPREDLRGLEYRGASEFRADTRRARRSRHPRGISRPRLSIADTRSCTARLPGAWRCNTLGSRIVGAETRRITQPRAPPEQALHPLHWARQYVRPGGGGGPQRSRRTRGIGPGADRLWISDALPTRAGPPARPKRSNEMARTARKARGKSNEFDERKGDPATLQYISQPQQRIDR